MLQNKPEGDKIDNYIEKNIYMIRKFSQDKTLAEDIRSSFKILVDIYDRKIYESIKPKL